jgi:hypothetical protein
MRRIWPVLVGVFFGTLCVISGVIYTLQTAGDRMSCELEWVELSVQTLMDGNVVGVVSCTNHTRLNIRYEGVTGDLLIDDRQVDYAIRGLNVGDTFEPGVAVEAKVVLKLGAMDLLAFGSSIAQGRSLHGEMKGTASASVFGIRVDVPLEQTADVGWLDLGSK